MASWVRCAVLLVVACGYHDTPVATYRAPIPEPDGTGGVASGGTGGSAGASATAGVSEAGATVAAGAGGEAGASSEPACLRTYSLVPPGLTSRYRHAQVGVTWVEAERDCEAEGAHLVVVDDAAENDWLKSLAELAVTEDASTNQLMWLGVGDHAKESEFVWVNGATLGFTRWADSEPNSLNGAEDCGEIRSSGDWNDDRCNAPLTYVCECDARPSVGNWCDTSLHETCGDCSTRCADEQACVSQKCE